MFIARLLPRQLYRRIYPAWVRTSLALEFFRKKGWQLYYVRPILSWVAEKSVGDRSLSIVVRSYREFRRFRNFGIEPNHIVFRWLRDLKACDTFYDIGASNGIVGFAAHYLHRCKTVFIEPYTPSIESILKSIYVATQRESKHTDFEVVHAGLDSEENYSRLTMHRPPIPGVTLNTFKDTNLYDAAYDRNTQPISITQWLKGISLDALHFTYQLPAPTHVKIDIDGYESRAIQGAQKLIASRKVSSWCIEINSQANLDTIRSILENKGYQEVEHQVHHPNAAEYAQFPADYIFVRGSE